MSLEVFTKLSIKQLNEASVSVREALIEALSINWKHSNIEMSKDSCSGVSVKLKSKSGEEYHTNFKTVDSGYIITSDVTGHKRLTPISHTEEFSITNREFFGEENV